MTTKAKPPEQKIEEDAPKSRLIDPAQVKKGHLMAFVYYAHVADVNALGYHVSNGVNLKVKGLDNNQGEFGVHGKELVQNAFSADVWAEEKSVNQTEMIEVLMRSYNRPFTVVFTKDDGVSERTLRGRLIEPDGLRGRSKVEDMDEPEGKRFRLVDHRTLKSLVVDGVKYSIKKR